MGPRRIAVAALLGLALVVPALAQSQSSDNLVRNPGAEEPPPTVDATGQPYEYPAPPGWTISEGQFTVGQYGAAGFPDAGDASEINGGERFFAGGPAPIPGIGQSYASQNIDVSADAAAIDRGGVRAEISAAIGGKDAEDDLGSISVQFQEAGGAQISAITIGPVTPADRGLQTRLLPRSAAAVVPAGTRVIRVLLIAEAGEGEYIDAYFDNVRLTLPGATHVQAPRPGTVPAPDTPSTPGPTPEADERSRRGAVAYVSGRAVRLSRSGVIRLRTACLRRDVRCRGALSVRAGRTRCASRRVTVPARRVRRVTLRMTRRCRSLAARRRGGLRVRVRFALPGEVAITARTVVRPPARSTARRR